jgi:hypothetical protein
MGWKLDGEWGQRGRREWKGGIRREKWVWYGEF